tara:strand:+ start:5385 stop:6395 length:1011 start_codon:yes stop_codon:yes gene_type:complete
MPFEKVEFSLPDPDTGDEGIEIEVAPSSAKTMGAPDETPASPPEEDFAVEVVDDTPKADRNRKASDPPEDVTEDELGEYSEKVQKRIKHFSKGYHDERRAKEAALRERQELERVTQQLIEENKNLKGTVGKNQTALLDQAKHAVDTELAEAKRAYKDAYESGDSEAVLEAQESLTTAKIKADRLSNIKLPPLQSNELPVDSEEPNNQPAPAQVDARAEEWAKSNPWFGTDDEMTGYALGLHEKLVKSGVSPQSDEYYEALNSRMQKLFPENFDSDEVAEDDTPRRQANVVAPATRSTAPKKVVLTQTQVTLAKRLGLTPKQYAEQVAIDMRKAKNG